jgi:hypothetical protein
VSKEVFGTSGFFCRYPETQVSVKPRNPKQVKRKLQRKHAMVKYVFLESSGQFSNAATIEISQKGFIFN